MSDIFREVDEALQKEKAARFWKENGPTIILAVVVLVLSTAATTAYKTWDLWRDHQETSKLIAAQNTADVNGYIAAASETRKSHEAIALITAGNKAAEAKDFVKAAELYGQVSSNASAPSELRDLATILSVRAQGMTNSDDTDYKGQLETLDAIAKNDKSPFQMQAKLEAALIEGSQLGDYAAALKRLEGFEEGGPAGSLEEKARALRHVFEYEQSKSAQ